MNTIFVSRLKSTIGVCILYICIRTVGSQLLNENGQHYQLCKVFENCHRNSTNFDACMKMAFNELRLYFKSGLHKLDWIRSIHVLLYLHVKFQDSPNCILPHSIHIMQHLWVHLFSTWNHKLQTNERIWFSRLSSVVDWHLEKEVAIA